MAAKQDQDRPDLRDAQHEHHDSQHRREWHAGYRESYATKHGLQQGRDDHAQRDPPDGLRSEHRDAIAALAGEPTRKPAYPGSP